MVKIAFHDNCLCERGTTISLYDYAYYNKHYLGNESIIMYIGNDKRNVSEVLDKFKKEFVLRPYIDWSKEADHILKEEGCDILYMQKAGEWDGKNTSVCKSIIHCVFNTQYKHGDVYGRISNCFKKHGNPFKVIHTILNDYDGEVDWYEMKNTGDYIKKECTYHFSKCLPFKKECTKLDTLFQNEKFDLIKIDVQGAEMNVLEGGKEMIKHTSFNGNAIFRSI